MNGRWLLGQAVAFLLAYIAGMRVLMYANTVWFDLGDVKFGTSGWHLYWPLWSVFYAPVAVAAVVATYRSRLPAGPQTALLWGCWVVILLCVEVSFWLDIHWTVLLFKWGLLSASFFAVAHIWREHRSVNRSGRT